MELQAVSLEGITQLFSDTLYGQQRLLFSALTIRFERGKWYGLVGASGSGKSTLLHIIAGLQESTQGRVHVHYDSGLIISPREALKRGSFGLVFQLPLLIDEFSVLENVVLHGLLQDNSLNECRERGRYLLERIGLSRFEDSHPKILSFGQQQRVALARALFAKPAFLIADEPTAALDLETTEQILALIREFQAELGMGVIIATHDPLVKSLFSQVVQL